MISTRLNFAFFLGSLIAALPARADIGLALRFGDVILEDVKPNRIYDLRDVAHVPFGVENHGDADADIIVEFVRPPKNELSKDYEQIPDPSWFKAIPSKMRIGAHQIGYFDIVLNTPDDETNKGRHFQVTAIARTTGQGMFDVGVENKIRFSFGPGPDSIAAEKKKKAMQHLDFDVTPQDMYLTGVAPGTPFDAKKEAKKTIRVANYSSDPLAVKMTIEKWNPNIPLPEGYEPLPDLTWLKLKDPTIKVAGEAIGLASVIVNIPNDEKLKGRHFAALIRTGLTSGFWLDAPVKIYIETKP